MTAMRDDVEVHAENFAALSKAIEDRDLARMRELLEGGASVNTWEEGQWGMTRAVLHVAARADFAEGVKLLIEHGADMTAEDGRYLPIQEAVLSGGVAALEVLIESGASTKRINRGLAGRTGSGRRPLETAAEEGMTDAAEMLLRLSPSSREEPGISYALTTALEWQGRGRDRKKLIEHLVQYGARPAPHQAKAVYGPQPTSVVRATMPNDPSAAKVVIAQCAQCGGPLRNKRGSLRPVLHMMCKCGHKNEVHVDSTIIEKMNPTAGERKSAARPAAAAPTPATATKPAAATKPETKSWPLTPIVVGAVLVVGVLVILVTR